MVIKSHLLVFFKCDVIILAGGVGDFSRRPAAKLAEERRIFFSAAELICLIASK